MHRGSAHVTVPVPFVEPNSEEDICRLRSAICDEGFIGRPLKIGIFQVDIGKAVTCRRQIDQPPTCAKQRRNPVDQDEVAEVIGAELSLKSIRRMAERCRHHSRVGDDHIKGFMSCQ